MWFLVLFCTLTVAVLLDSARVRMNVMVTSRWCFRFEEIVDVSVPKPSALQIHVNNKYIIVYTPRVSVSDRYTNSGELF